uniref:hypothetical protein n=1 Tax=Nocardia yamanashiensis TaxID=209247 RepID=UPI000B0781C7
DGSISTSWYFNTRYDKGDQGPRNQIASLAVHDLQNIGDYCVWLNAGDLSFTKPILGHRQPPC